MKNITPKEAYLIVNDKPNSFIVDVREIEEGEGSSIPGAIKLPLTRLMAETEFLKNKSNLFFICASGGRSSMAAEYVESQGFENIYNIDGGIMAWQESKLPLE